VVVKLLIKKGSDVDYKDRLGQKPLSWAIKEGKERYEAVVKLLLEKGADVDSKEVEGRTPLSWAVGRGRGRW
jgi:ankyrin repeat protein